MKLKWILVVLTAFLVVANAYFTQKQYGIHAMVLELLFMAVTSRVFYLIGKYDLRTKK